MGATAPKAALSATACPRCRACSQDEAANERIAPRGGLSALRGAGAAPQAVLPGARGGVAAGAVGVRGDRLAREVAADDLLVVLRRAARVAGDGAAGDAQRHPEPELRQGVRAGRAVRAELPGAAGRGAAVRAALGQSQGPGAGASGGGGGPGDARRAGGAAERAEPDADVHVHLAADGRVPALGAGRGLRGQLRGGAGDGAGGREPDGAAGGAVDGAPRGELPPSALPGAGGVTPRDWWGAALVVAVLGLALQAGGVGWGGGGRGGRGGGAAGPRRAPTR